MLVGAFAVAVLCRVCRPRSKNKLGQLYVKGSGHSSAVKAGRQAGRLLVCELATLQALQ